MSEQRSKRKRKTRPSQTKKSTRYRKPKPKSKSQRSARLHVPSGPAETPRLFLFDEDVPHSLAETLVERGHLVRFVGDEIPGAKDPQVAGYADDIGATLVTFNVKHFRPLIRRGPPFARQDHPNYDASKTLRNAGIIMMNCSRAIAPKRIDASLTLIEFEFDRGSRRSDQRVVLELETHQVVVMR